MNDGRLRIQNRNISSVAGRNIRFWGYTMLETAGIILAVAVGLFVFFTLGNGNFSDGQKLQELLAMFPYYLYLGGGFSVLMMTIGYFQVYFSLLVSMNNKRTGVAAGIIISTLLLIIFVNAGAWLIWKLIDTEAARTAVRLVPVFTGVSLMTGAFSLLLGVIITRWGKIGTIILACVCMIVGGLFGAGMVALDNILDLILWFAGRSLWEAAIVGMILYGLTGFFTIMAIRRVEIRS